MKKKYVYFQVTKWLTPEEDLRSSTLNLITRDENKKIFKVTKGDKTSYIAKMTYKNWLDQASEEELNNLKDFLKMSEKTEKLIDKDAAKVN
jgi:hypothetical protein